MKKSTPFDKFAKKKSNAAIKEQFRQEKRKVKKGMGAGSAPAPFRFPIKLIVYVQINYD
jgi:hypothetical protein